MFSSYGEGRLLRVFYCPELCYACKGLSMFSSYGEGRLLRVFYCPELCFACAGLSMYKSFGLRRHEIRHNLKSKIVNISLLSHYSLLTTHYSLLTNKSLIIRFEIFMPFRVRRRLLSFISICFWEMYFAVFFIK